MSSFQLFLKIIKKSKYEAFLFTFWKWIELIWKAKGDYCSDLVWPDSTSDCLEESEEEKNANVSENKKVLNCLAN